MSRLTNLTREWKLYILLAGMVVIAGYLFYLDGKIERIAGRLDGISSTIESIEGITTGTDYTLKQIETKVAEIEAQVSTIAQRVKRRKK
jgi:hypothetical protein